MKFWNPFKKTRNAVTINLKKAIQENVDKILREGKIKTKEDRVLITAISRIGRFLRSRNDQVSREDISYLEEQQKEIGLFFPAITEIILDWKEEGKLDILDKIDKLAENRRPNRKEGSHGR
ncbi:MAG: hypothetical protein E3J36_02695 [Candidatus Nealsonbacteria bacterium]|nr:MAG: hypothetical protein E3J36_02695 [Candidatus Nealsonbacteria bacterium]